MDSAEAVVDLTIRDAELTDAAALAALMGELGYATTTAEMTARLEAILPDSRYRTFVGILDNQLCGMIGTVAQPSHEHNDLSGRIVAMVVSKPMRRRGVARKLIVAAERDFAKRAITRVSLTTRLTREEAHRFYEQLGYTKNGFRYAKELTEISD